MRMVLALVVGYIIGAAAGSKDVDRIVRSVKSVRESEEYADLVSAVRVHAAHTLRELAAMVDGSGRPSGEDGNTDEAGHLDEIGEAGDLVDRVKQLFARG